MRRVSGWVAGVLLAVAGVGAEAAAQGRPGTATPMSAAAADRLPVRWNPEGRRALRVAIDLSTLPPADRPRGRMHVEGALRAWQQAGLAVEWVRVAQGAEADVTVAWAPSLRGPELGVTTLTVSPPEPGGSIGSIVSAQIVLSLTDPRGRTLGAEELRAAAVHEVGHALGLPHSADRRTVMYPVLGARQIGADDVAAARRLYGRGAWSR